MKLTTKIIPDNKIYAYLSLYPGKDPEEVRKILCDDLLKRMKRVAATAIIVILLSILSIFFQKTDGMNVLERENVNGSTVSVPILVVDEWGEQEVLLTLNPLRMNEGEIDAMQKEVSDALDRTVLSGNPSFEEVYHDLYLPEELEGFPVLLSWSTSDPGKIQTNGRVLNDDLENAFYVTICARVLYGEEFRLYERQAILRPPILNEAERKARSLLKELSEYENETEGEKEFVLPEEIDGAKIEPVRKKKIPKALPGVFLGTVLLVGAWSNFFSSLGEKKKARFTKAEIQCKEFLSKLSILLAAGMPLRGAWKKITEDFGEEKDRGMLYENMAVTCREFMNGSTENTAYERFGERMEITRYQRIAAVLSQSVTKGVAELPELLSAEIREAVADEREQIRIRGEQAGTKLLMPMMGFLTIVFAILLVPAFITF
ncbi:MAG: type II secretion system F family protein [Lachnospiraceae bacterium]|nr:type II secretion system F family protein [Lachnospiraceae bacterium]